MPASSEQPQGRVELPKTGPGSVVSDKGRIDKETADALAELAGSAAVSAAPAAEPAATGGVLREEIERMKQAIATRRNEHVENILNGGSINTVPERERAYIMRLVEERRAEIAPAPVVEPTPIASQSEANQTPVPPEPVAPTAEPAASPVTETLSETPTAAEVQGIEPEVARPKDDSTEWSPVVSQSQSKLTDVQADSRRRIDRARKESEELEVEIKGTTLPQSDGRNTDVREIKRQLELKQITQEEADRQIEKIVCPKLVKGREEIAHDRSSAELEADSATAGLALLERWKYYLSHPEIAREIEAAVTKVTQMKREIEMSYVGNAAKYGQDVSLDDVRQKLEKGFITQDEADMLINKPAVLELRDAQAYLDSLRGQIPAEFLGQETDKINLETVSGRITAEAIEKLRAIIATRGLAAQGEGQPVAEVAEKEAGQEITLTDEQKANLSLLKLQLEGKTPEEQEALIKEWLENNGISREQWKYYLGLPPVEGVEGSQAGERIEITLTDEQKANLSLLKLQLEGKTPEEQEALIKEWLENNGISREQWEYFKGLPADSGSPIDEGARHEQELGRERTGEEQPSDDVTGEHEEEGDSVEEVAEPTHDQAAPTAEAVDNVINKLLEKYTSEPAKERAGWIRGGLIPLIGGIAGSTGTQFLLKLTGAAARWSSPAIAAVTAFVGSVSGSAARWKFQGENALRLFARYSHTERTKSGKRQLLRLWTRGAERGALRRQLKISGPPKEFAARFDETSGNFDLNNLTPEQKMGMIESGAWYLLATKGVDQLGAYLSDADSGVITEWTPRVQKAVAEIYNGLTPDQKQTIDTELEARLGRRQGRYHKLEVLEVAGIGALKAAALAEAVTLIFQNFHHITDLFRGKPKPVEASGTPTGPEVNPDSPLRTHGPSTNTPGPTPTGTPGTPPTGTGVVEIPKPPETPSTLLSIDKNVGHTLAENGKAVDWTNTDQWHRLLDVNNTAVAIKQTELWSTGSQIAKAIAGDPDKYLVGLSVEDKALAFRMAKEAVAAFNKAGFDASTGLLTRPEALDRNEIIAAFWWVIQNKKLAA